MMFPGNPVGPESIAAGGRVGRPPTEGGLTMTRMTLGVSLGLMLAGLAGAQDRLVYEMRTYTIPTGKFRDLDNRFRQHTVKLLEKHGVGSVIYLTPLEGEKKIVFVLSHKSRPAADAAYKAFQADPDWQKVYAESEKNGKLVEKIDRVFLNATDYSPSIVPKVATPRVFEIRTYKTPTGRLPNLNARFRDHTVKLFEKHGMTNIAYWNLLPGEPEADNTLVYILAHRDREAARKSFDSFRKDPDWNKARTESEAKAGGSLTVPGPEGVKSEFFNATDYSPIR
jgi:hypothetical protein